MHYKLLNSMPGCRPLDASNMCIVMIKKKVVQLYLLLHSVQGEQGRAVRTLAGPEFSGPTFSDKHFPL